MKYLLICCLLSNLSFAQTEDGIFVFTMHDMEGHYLTPETPGMEMQAFVQYEEDLVLPVQQLSGTELLYIRFPKTLAGKYLMIQAGKSTGDKVDVMQIAVRTADEGSLDGCYRCWVSNILFSPSRLMADTPRMKESWDILPVKSIFLNGEELSCIDISILQPFAIAFNK